LPVGLLAAIHSAVAVTVGAAALAMAGVLVLPVLALAVLALLVLAVLTLLVLVPALLTLLMPGVALMLVMARMLGGPRLGGGGNGVSERDCADNGLHVTVSFNFETSLEIVRRVAAAAGPRRA
jgi:hypothetical protein